ncbi:MAG: hypothetical protein J0M23_07020 [Rickettsiales bacterium]|nr:hypothetical protein [Rickettsiales bacterium]
MTQLLKDLTEIVLQEEMDANLQENSLEEGGNRRNGFKKKIIKGSEDSFELQIVKTRQTVLNDKLWTKNFSAIFTW